MSIFRQKTVAALLTYAAKFPIIETVRWIYENTDIGDWVHEMQTA
jgi:hypothetical protein